MKILETSEEYRQRLREKEKKNACPECGYRHNMSSYHTEYKGFFRMKAREVHSARCFRCGCLYEYADDWE